MSINIRTKGQNGEREIAFELNSIIKAVLTELQMPIPQIDIVQRNQNQSAVGGNDLCNVFGLSIEVKRHETLSINTWWKQCEAAAVRNNEIPVLIFRQNRKPWRVITYAYLDASQTCELLVKVRCELSFEDFQHWFYLWVRRKLVNGEQVQV